MRPLVGLLWATCCLTLVLLLAAIREFVSKKSCLGVSGSAGDKLFFTRTNSTTSSPSGSVHEDMSEEYMLGVIVGLACYNGVLVNLPLVDIVYKLFNRGQVSFTSIKGSAVCLVIILVCQLPMLSFVLWSQAYLYCCVLYAIYDIDVIMTAAVFGWPSQCGPWVGQEH